MQRINFTETTLNTLKRNANCSFANAVYKLGIKAQQGLKCDDLFKKSVLMNEVNKLLCKYKLDECISFHPELEGGISTWYFGLGSFTGILTYNLIIDGVETYIGQGDSVINIVTSINNNTEGTGVSAVLGEDNYFTIFSPIGCFVRGDLTGFKTPAGTVPATLTTFTKGKCPQESTCIEYTEEELNCITPQDLQVLYEFTHKYKETLAKSTKKINNQTTNNSNSTSSDCCNWGSIGGSIGNQSDLVAYLNTIEKNLISVSDETTEITGDLKGLKFTGNGVTATNSNGEVTVNIPGGGGGGSITASNGLTESSDNVKLGGSLIEDTNIDFSNYRLFYTGNVASKSNALLNVETTSGLGAALKIESIKNGININSQDTSININSTVKGLNIETSTNPIIAYGTGGSFFRKVDSVALYDTILALEKTNLSNNPSSFGTGVGIAFVPGNDSTGVMPNNSFFKCLYQDPTNGAIETKFVFSPLGTGTTTFQGTLETRGNGAFKLNAYGQTPANFTGTPVWLLGVDSSGNVIETSASGGGSTDLGYTASATNGIVTSSTGTDATLPLADATNAGLLKPAKFTVLENTSGTNSGDNATNTQYSGLAASKQDVITGLTASGAELNILDGATLTTTELNYVDGVTSSIQTQLDAKKDTYAIQCGAAIQAVVSDSTSYHMGIAVAATLNTTAALRRFKFTDAGTLKTVSWNLFQTVNGSGETVNLYLRNETAGTDASIGTFTSNFGASAVLSTLFTGLSITVNTTDDYTFKIVTPVLATNPTNWLPAAILSVTKS